MPLTEGVHREPLIPELVEKGMFTNQGKVSDRYDIGDDRLLIVPSDAISTHNVVHKSYISYKGQVLTALTHFWCMKAKEWGIETDHLAIGEGIIEHLPADVKDAILKNREDILLTARVVKKLDLAPIEFIFRKYLTGSLYNKFYSKGKEDPYMLNLPEGLQHMHEFENPIFTPTEKSDDDDPVPSITVVHEYPDAFWKAYTFYRKAMEFALERGLSILDTKFEATPDGIICDEKLTPDSSRFGRTEDIIVGSGKVPWMDKQVVRDEAETIWGKGEKYPLEFSTETIQQATAIYREVFKILTGLSLEEYQKMHLAA